ncbi:MAG: TIGR04255 family protein [Clostridia bacterium]|nr:TIGR04255 family protein [Clostridia bacterium]
MGKNTQRTDLKKYLTKDIIIRIDYMPLADSVVDELVANMSSLLFDKYGFSNVFEGVISSVDVQFNNPEISNNQSFFNVNNYTKIKSMEILRFIEKEMYMKIIINKHFSCININSGVKYIPYDKYIEIYKNIIDALYEKNTKIKRIGFRKFNEFFQKEVDEKNILENLNPHFFEYNYDFIKENESEMVNDLLTERKYTFEYNQKQINIITHLSKGLLNMEKIEKVERAAVDIDISINNLENIKSIVETKSIKSTLDEINLIIFKVFKNMLSEEFLKKLCGTDDLEDYYIGVNNNE